MRYLKSKHGDLWKEFRGKVANLSKSQTKMIAEANRKGLKVGVDDATINNMLWSADGTAQGDLAFGDFDYVKRFSDKGVKVPETAPQDSAPAQQSGVTPSPSAAWNMGLPGLVAGVALQIGRGKPPPPRPKSKPSSSKDVLAPSSEGQKKNKYRE